MMRPRKSNLSRNSSVESASDASASEPLPRLLRDESNLDNADEPPLAVEEQRPSLFVMQVTAVASLGGILFGYDLGVISGALPQMIVAFDLTSAQQELVVSILYLGGGFGAMLGGSICDSFGRKRAILLTDGWFLLGAAVLYLAPTLSMVVVGRVIVGFAIAVSGIADVSYLHEIAPAQWRGAIVSVNEACISLGFLLAFAMGSIFSSEGESNGWRAMFGISGLVAALQLVGMWTMPESPTWLKKQGRLEEAETALRRINSDFSFVSATELEVPTRRSTTLYDTVVLEETHTEAVVLERSNTGLFGRLFFYSRQIIYLFQQFRSFVRETMARHRRQAYIALFLAVTQQLCGQTNVLSYAPIIFAGVSGNASSASYVRGWSTLSIGLVKFAVTVVVIWKIERVGRRFLLLLGMSTIAVGLLLLIFAFAGTHPDVNDSQDTIQDTGEGMFLALPGVLLVVCGYSMSFGPLTWLLTSELFPTEIRGRALGASTIVTYLCAAMVTYTFLSAQEWLGPSIVFGSYLTATLLGLVFACLAVPDTKERSEEEIEEDLDQMPWWRGKPSSEADTSPLFGSTNAQMVRLPNVQVT